MWQKQNLLVLAAVILMSGRSHAITVDEAGDEYMKKIHQTPANYIEESSTSTTPENTQAKPQTVQQPNTQAKPQTVQQPNTQAKPKNTLQNNQPKSKAAPAPTQAPEPAKVTKKPISKEAVTTTGQMTGTLNCTCTPVAAAPTSESKKTPAKTTK